MTADAPATTSEDPRLAQVIDFLTRMAAGDLDARIQPSESGDTLDVLVTGLNMLAEELSSSIRLERHLRETLEERVQERTAELQSKLDTIEVQDRTIRELSTPCLRLWDDVLALPVIGTVDSARAQQIIETLLAEIAHTKATIVILDITGVPVVDSAVVGHFLQAARAAELLGAQAILTGVSPQNAQTMVRLGVDFKGIQTQNTLQAGLRWALKRTGEREQGPFEHRRSSDTDPNREDPAST